MRAAFFLFPKVPKGAAILRKNPWWSLNSKLGGQRSLDPRRSTTALHSLHSLCQTDPVTDVRSRCWSFKLPAHATLATLATLATFLICRGLKLFLLAVTVTLLSALGVWQRQLFTFHRRLVRCHFYPTIHAEKSVVLRGASTPFVSKSHCSPPGIRPEATWCWIDFEIAVSCFFKRTPWGTKFPLNLMTFSSFSPHRNCLTVKLRSINDHWGHWKKNMQS